MSANENSPHNPAGTAVTRYWDAGTVSCQVDLAAAVAKVFASWSLQDRRTRWDGDDRKRVTE